MIATHSRATFRCEFAAIGDAMALASGFADSLKLTQEDAVKLQLVVEELMTNTIRHGLVDPDKEISIELIENDGAVKIQYCDQGTAFDPSTYEAPAPEAQDPAGYGWILIRGFCRNIAYNRLCDINRTSLELPIGSSNAA